MAKWWRRFADWAKSREQVLRLADRLGRGRGRLRWLDRLTHVPPAPRRPSLIDWERRELSAVWIGHATVLLRVGGLTVLTDPVLSRRIGIGLGLITAGPARRVLPALSHRELPKVDLILLSHAHFDHVDVPTLARFSGRTPVITAAATADLARSAGLQNVRELRWGESITIGQLTITARPVVHWGARAFFDRHRGYNAYLLQSPTKKVLFAGDTAFHHGFDDLAGVDLAILGIGAYNPYRAAHATPEENWAMAERMQARHVLPMHHSTFRLSYEPVDEPMQRFRAAAGNQAHRLVGVEVGSEFSLI